MPNPESSNAGREAGWELPDAITYNPVYDMHYVGALPAQGYVYRREQSPSPMTAPDIRAAVERVTERMERDTRGMTHDGSQDGTAHWWTRQRYDDVHLLLTDRERLERELGEARRGLALQRDELRNQGEDIRKATNERNAAEARSKGLERALIKVAGEVGPAKAYAESYGLEGGQLGSAVHIKLDLIAGYCDAALTGSTGSAG